jgi:hypothetical protein
MAIRFDLIARNTVSLLGAVAFTAILVANSGSLVTIA